METEIKKTTILTKKLSKWHKHHHKMCTSTTQFEIKIN